MELEVLVVLAPLTLIFQPILGYIYYYQASRKFPRGSLAWYIFKGTGLLIGISGLLVFAILAILFGSGWPLYPDPDWFSAH